MVGTKETDCRSRKGGNPCCAVAKHLTKILTCNNLRVSHVLTDLSAPREAVGKNQTVSVHWPLLVGDFRQCVGRHKTGKLDTFEVLKPPRPQIVGNNIEKTVSNRGPLEDHLMAAMSLKLWPSHSIRTASRWLPLRREKHKEKGKMSKKTEKYV